MSSSTAENNFNVVAAVLGIAFTIIPLSMGWLYTRLPCTMLRQVDSCLAETEQMFHEALEDGMLSRSSLSLASLHSNLWLAKSQALFLRNAIPTTNSWWDELKGWQGGLSKTASLLCEDLTNIKMKIIKHSSRQRERGGSEACKASFALMCYKQEQISSLLSKGATPLCASLGDFAAGLTPGYNPFISRCASHELPQLHKTSTSPSEEALYRQVMHDFGRRLFGTRSSRVATTGNTKARLRQAEKKGRLRAIFRSTLRRFTKQSTSTDGPQTVLDVDPALFAALHLADDSDPEWEDDAHIGQIHLSV